MGLVLFAFQEVTLNDVAAQATSVPFTVGGGGANSIATSGNDETISVGYARIEPDDLNTTPSGVAIFGLRQGGVLISEAGVPASAPILSGRIYAEVNESLNTGLAIANPNGQDAVISYYFSDETRDRFGENEMTIPAGGHISAFLTETPFNAVSPINGTFTFSSNVAVAAIALRGLTNARSEFLMTTLPVSPLTARTNEIVYFPHFADGEGWITEVILVNPTDDAMTGTVEFLGQGSSIADAAPVNVTINSQTAATFSYSIPGRSSRRPPDSRNKHPRPRKLGARATDRRRHESCGIVGDFFQGRIHNHRLKPACPQPKPDRPSESTQKRREQIRRFRRASRW